MITIRLATTADAPSLLEIYAPYVQETAISFEYVAPSLEEFTARISSILERYPYIVAEQEGRIVGYSYAHAFHPRKAFEWAVETTIYVRQGVHHAGLGRLLYSKLEECLLAQGVSNLYACIAYSEAEDEHLTHDSPAFHEHMGYRTIGHFSQCGYKFGRWYDMIWMEKIIAPHPLKQLPLKDFPSVKDQIRF